MQQRPLYIAFSHHQVCVQVDAPEALAKIEHWFDAMLESVPICVVKQLTVTKQDDK
jgi:hypothetical protein